MNPWSSVFLSLALLGGPAAVSAQSASPSTPALPAAPKPLQADLWRQVIEAQLDAFAADDGIAAFSFASPGIRRMFGSPETFLNMVRQAYPAVYRPASVTFLAPRESEGGGYQPVRIIDGNGRPWVALYRLQKQSDGTWRIDGCELIGQGGTST